MKELNRFLRHVFAPFVAWLVAKGYLPEYMQGDVIEVLVLAVGFGVPFALSWARDKMRE
jgi:hypothetical protein